MAFNELPSGYDADKLGPQKRETEFPDEAAKAGSDAENLIEKARGSLQAAGVESASRAQVLQAIQIIVGVHRKDYNGALNEAIQTQLASLDSAQEQEAVTKYEQYIDALELSPPDKAKLIEMMSRANYANAVATAVEMKASRIPTYDQIANALMVRTLQSLKDICELMEQPKLDIVSDKGFDESVTAMDENKHYTSAGGEDQNDAYVHRGSDSPYKNLTKQSDKVVVSVVDGKVRPKQLNGVSKKLAERRDFLTAKFQAKAMRHINEKEMATLIQQSLREAEAAKDNSLIVDNWEDGDGTVTFLDPQSLTESTLVAYALFYSNYRQARFNALDSRVVYGYARGRAAVQVLEI